jgi:hypothetical protein
MRGPRSGGTGAIFCRAGSKAGAAFHKWMTVALSPQRAGHQTDRSVQPRAVVNWNGWNGASRHFTRWTSMTTVASSEPQARFRTSRSLKS